MSLPGPPPRFVRRFGPTKDALRRLYKRTAPRRPVDVTVDGLTFRCLPADNKVDFDIWYKRRLEEAEEREFLAAHLGDGDWFVDIGANIGLYPVSLLTMVPGARAVGFEPLKRLRVRLATNCVLNGVYERMVVRPEAVGPTGTMPLFESGNAGRASLRQFQGSRGATRVKVRPLAQMLEEVGASPAALKIDVEGYEDEALLPYFDEVEPGRWPRALVIETLHRALWRRDCLQTLLEKGYTEVGNTDENALLVLSGKRGR